MIRIGSAVGALLAILLLAGLAVPGERALSTTPPAAAAMTVQPPLPAKLAAPTVTLPPPVRDVMQSGVLIVISKASQQMYVFKDGALWGSSPVSTGRRGKATPAGVFPILQKRRFHRSNLYSNAPMPFMQRLTWSGIAIHAGHLPGYPASHGCIRLPASFARSLFQLTNAASTTVVVTNSAARSDSQAVELALAAPAPRGVAAPGSTQQAAPALAAAPPRIEAISPLSYQSLPQPGRGQTIQLTAAPSPGEAEASWARLVGRHPELARFNKAIIPAVVGSRQVYRLRVSAPGAHAYCTRLKSQGIDCFNVT